MFPLSGASLFYEPYDRYSFGGWVPYYDQARSIVKYFVEMKRLNDFGIIYQDDEMGAIMLKGIRDQLAVQNLELKASESYKRGATDFSSQVAKLRKAGVEIVILGTVTRETVASLKEAHKLGWKPAMCALSPAYNKDVLDLCRNAGISADGLYLTGQSPYPYVDSSTPSVADWVKRHIQWFGKEPDLPTMAGYTAMDFFAMAARRAGRDLTRERLVDALESMGVVKDDIFGGPDTTFTKTSHKGAEDALLLQVRNGRFVVIGVLGHR